MPKTKTEAIAAALLDAVDRDADAETALSRYQGSKGPLYLALASVLDTLRARLDGVLAELRTKEAERATLAGELAALDARRHEAEATVAGLAGEAQDLESRRQALAGEVEAAAALARRGFGADELARLGDILARIAADQGAPPEEGVKQFFATLGRYAQVVALDLEARRAGVAAAAARAERERCEAELRRTEARSQARREAVAITEQLLAQGVKAGDLPFWQRVLAKALVPVEEVARALQDYVSLAALAEAGRAESAQLRGQVARLRQQVAALERKREGIAAEIAAVRDTAITAVEGLAMDARRQLVQVREAVAALGALRQEAGRLGAKLALAQMLELEGEERARRWAAAPLVLIAESLFGLIAWADAHDEELAPPTSLVRAHYWLQYHRLPAADLLRWFSAAVSRAFEDAATRPAAT